MSYGPEKVATARSITQPTKALVRIPTDDAKNTTVYKDKPEPLTVARPNECKTLRCQQQACKVAYFSDSCALWSPSREFWFAKGWQNRIRHVDPPQGNLFQQLKRTQRARTHDPDL